MVTDSGTLNRCGLMKKQGLAHVRDGRLEVSPVPSVWSSDSFSVCNHGNSAARLRGLLRNLLLPSLGLSQGIWFED